MKKVEELKELNDCSKKINHFINQKLPKIRRDFEDKNNTTDKHSDGWSINGDKIQSVNIDLTYSSFTGSHGNSSTYSDLNFNTSLFKTYFIKYLNKHTSEIFNEIAKMMDNDSKAMYEDALAEIESILNSIR